MSAIPSQSISVSITQMSRRSLLPQQASANNSSVDAVPSFSKLASTRNSLVPLRQPLAQVNNNNNQQQSTLTAQPQKRVSLHPDADRPNKVSRVSLAPTSAPTSISVGFSSPALVPEARPVGQPTEINADNRPGYNSKMIIGKHGEELSFEEVRAGQVRYLFKKSALRMSELPIPVNTVTATPSASINLSSSFTPDHLPSNQGMSHPSPTICTRAAMNDIDAMFKDSPITPGARDHNSISFASTASCVPFSARSLTTEIPTMDGSQYSNDHRGRPSPVAFAVFTDEELMTRNIQIQAAANKQKQQEAKATPVSIFADADDDDFAMSDKMLAAAKRHQSGKTAVFVDPDVENRPPQAGATTASNNVRRPLAAREDVQVRAEEDAYQVKYPPLTPILEISHESDMSHASNTSMGAPTPAAAASHAVSQPIAEEPASSAVAGSDSIIDPFDSTQRAAWINELSALSSSGVTDLASNASGLDLAAIASGAETSLEIGDKLFQITKVLSVSGSGNDQVVSVQAENLLDGGEMEVRLAPACAVLEQHFSASWMARVLTNDTSRTEASMKQLFALTQESVVYGDRSCSVSAVSSSGTMRGLLEQYAASNQSMDERLVAYYCYELLKSVYLMHVHSLLHNHLTLDSVWLRFEESGAWSDVWSAAGENGWDSKGVCVADFRSCIDRSLFQGEATYQCNSQSYLDGANSMMKFAQESLAHASWTEQVDFLSVCSIAYQMLFGMGEMECGLDEQTGQVQITKSFTSEFQSTTFQPFFETILNFRPEIGQQQASLDLLQLLLQHFEMALGMEVQGAVASSHIKNLLCKQQIMQLQKK